MYLCFGIELTLLVLFILLWICSGADSAVDSCRRKRKRKNYASQTSSPDSVASRTRHGLSQLLEKSPLSCRKDDAEVNVPTSYSFSFSFVFSKLMDHLYSKFSFVDYVIVFRIVISVRKIILLNNVFLNFRQMCWIILELEVILHLLKKP